MPFVALSGDAEPRGTCSVVEYGEALNPGDLYCTTCERYGRNELACPREPKKVHLPTRPALSGDSPGVSGKKISVSLTSTAVEDVTAMSADMGVSVSEVIRRALAAQKFINRELAAGSTILVRRADGSTERVEFLFA